jgi:hypothetical protein
VRKSKPVVRRGRKATGLRGPSKVSRVAQRGIRANAVRCRLPRDLVPRGNATCQEFMRSAAGARLGLRSCVLCSLSPSPRPLWRARWESRLRVPLTVKAPVPHRRVAQGRSRCPRRRRRSCSWQADLFRTPSRAIREQRLQRRATRTSRPPHHRRTHRLPRQPLPPHRLTHPPPRPLRQPRRSRHRRAVTACPRQHRVPPPGRNLPPPNPRHRPPLHHPPHARVAGQARETPGFRREPS